MLYGRDRRRVSGFVKIKIIHLCAEMEQSYWKACLLVFYLLDLSITFFSPFTKCKATYNIMQCKN